MNTDFRLSVGYFEHPKILKLERRLGEGAVLSHIRLLRFASMNKPDGRLASMDAEDVGIAAGHKGDFEPFVAALLALRLLDQDEDGYSLHDWSEWNPWAAGANGRSAKAKAAAATRWGHAQGQDAAAKSGGAPSKVSDTTSINEQCSEHDLAMPLSDSFPNPFPIPPPNLSEEEQPPNPPPGADQPGGVSGKSELPTEETVKPEGDKKQSPRPKVKPVAFEQVFQAYPSSRRESKPVAIQRWDKLKPSDDEVNAMLVFIEAAKKTDRWMKGYAKQFHVFLSERKWEDDLSGYADRDAPPSLFPSRASPPNLPPEDRAARNKKWLEGDSA